MFSVINVSTVSNERDQWQISHTSNARSISSRSLSILGRKPKLGPRLAIGDSWVDNFLVGGESDPARGLDLLAFVVQPPRNNRLGAILVGCGSLWWKHIEAIIELVVVSPIGVFTIEMLNISSLRRLQIFSYVVVFDIFAVAPRSVDGFCD